VLKPGSSKSEPLSSEGIHLTQSWRERGRCAAPPSPKKTRPPKGAWKRRVRLTNCVTWTHRFFDNRADRVTGLREVRFEFLFIRDRSLCVLETGVFRFFFGMVWRKCDPLVEYFFFGWSALIAPRVGRVHLVLASPWVSPRLTGGRGS